MEGNSQLQDEEFVFLLILFVGVFLSCQTNCIIPKPGAMRKKVRNISEGYCHLFHV